MGWWSSLASSSSRDRGVPDISRRKIMCTKKRESLTLRGGVNCVRTEGVAVDAPEPSRIHYQRHAKDIEVVAGPIVINKSFM